MPDDFEFANHWHGTVLHRCDRCQETVMVTVIIDTTAFLARVREVCNLLHIPACVVIDDTAAILSDTAGEDVYQVYQVYPLPEVKVVVTVVEYTDMLRTHKERHACASRN